MTTKDRNHLITTAGPLHDDNGKLMQVGYAKKLLRRYDRERVHAPFYRIKEWDYHLIMNERFALAFTLGDMGYASLVSASFIDLTRPFEHTESLTLPPAAFKLPQQSSDGDILYNGRRVYLHFEVQNGERRVRCIWRKFHNGSDLKADIRLYDAPEESMVIVTPWKDSNAFYYNQKINCMKAKGVAEYNGMTYNIDPSETTGMLDWGRGVWTYDNRWFWGTASAFVDDKPFGFNLGYGFGDTSAASENMVFYDGKASKLDDITFVIPRDNILKPWMITSSDGRFEADFVPLINRKADINLGIIRSDQNQVFGRMSGTTILDDGQTCTFSNIMSAIEVVHNRY